MKSDLVRIIENCKDKTDKEIFDYLLTEVPINCYIKDAYDLLMKIDTFLCCVFILLNFKEEGLSFLKSKGVFRVFNIINLNNINLIIRLLNFKNIYDFEISYLERKALLKDVLIDIKNDLHGYEEIFRKYGNRVINYLLAYCCQALRNVKTFKNQTSKNYNFDSYNSLTYINICDSVSLAVNYILINNLNCLDSKKSFYRNVNVKKIILFFNKFNKLSEYETLVDLFEHDINFEDKKISFESKDKLLLKTIHYGFIMDSYSMANTIVKQKENLSRFFKLEDIISDINHNYLDYFVQIIYENKNNLKKLSYKLNYPFLANFNSNNLFYEEAATMASLSHDFAIPFADAIKLKIKDNLEIIDIIKFKRIFQLISIKTLKALDTYNDDELFFNSVVQIMDLNELIKILLNVFQDYVKVESLIDMFNFSNDKSTKDILYCPLIVTGKFVIFSHMLCADAFLEKNAIKLAKKYSMNSEEFKVINNRKEYLESTLFNVCNSLGIKIKIENLHFSYKGNESDVDAIIYDDENLILIECKSPTIPCSYYELKTPFEQLKKAGKQLNLSSMAFSDENFCKTFFSKINIENKRRNIHTLILTSIREFNGYSFDGHPVRNFNEFISYIECGKIVFNKREYCISKFADNPILNILEFLSNKAPVFDFLSSMDDSEEIFHFQKQFITNERYGVNVNCTEEKIKARNLRINK